MDVAAAAAAAVVDTAAAACCCCCCCCCCCVLGCLLLLFLLLYGFQRYILPIGGTCPVFALLLPTVTLSSVCPEEGGAENQAGRP